MKDKGLPTAHCLLPAGYLLLTIVCLLLVSCGGGLTDEQRKKIKEEMKTSQIKKITEAEIVEATLAKGRALTSTLSKANADSLAVAESVKIKWLVANQTNASDIEKQLIEAYLSQAMNGTLDNVQKIGTDSLLYTVPIVEKRSDGVDETKGIWSICFSRKQIVLGL